MAPHGRPIRHDEQGNDGDRPPTELPHDPWAKPHLHVQPSEEVLNVADRGLDLDHEQGASGRLIGQQIIPAAIPVVVETDLGANLPPVAAKERCERLLEGGVMRVKQSIQLRASPMKVNEQLGAERLGDVSQGAECHRIESFSFDARDGPA